MKKIEIHKPNVHFTFSSLFFTIQNKDIRYLKYHFVNELLIYKI